MDLWKAVKDFMEDYYSGCGVTDAERIPSPHPLAAIVERASRDDAFRQRLLSSPVATLAAEGFPLPHGLRVEFVEEDGKTLYLPLPPYVGEVEEGKETEEKKLKAVVRRAVTDREFRRRLVEDPRAVLGSHGFRIPRDMRIVVLECTDDLIYAVLPPPEGGEARATAPFGFRVEGDVIFLEGRLDSAAAAVMRETLLSWEGDLTLDLGGLDYIGSAGLALLLAGWKRLRRTGRSLTLRHVRPEVRNVFALAGFDAEFGLTPPPAPS